MLQNPFKEHKSLITVIFLGGIFLFFTTYGGLTATPKFWHDEAVPFEIARNLAEFDKADIAVAPGIFWEQSYMTHATGFPLIFPLAGVFKIFGVGVLQSRLFMVAWMIVALATLFFVMRAFFDKKTAFFSVLLVATFSSFYANGRTGTGEIPGFFFLLLALYFLYQKKWHGLGGFFAALAAVTKPSMYLFVLPVFMLEILFTKKSVKRFFCEEGLRFIIGALPILLFWIWLINPSPFSIANWREMIAFYQNAFNAPSLLSQFPAILPELLTHSTLLYFFLLFLPIFIAWRKHLFSSAQNRLVLFLFFYGALSFFYFLRSPGWFRYLLGTELLILALLPAALEKTAESIFTFLASPASWLEGSPSLSRFARTMPARARKPVKMLSAVFFAIAFSQSLQYLFFAEIPSDTKSIAIAQFINKEILANDPYAAIGIVDYAPVAALIAADRKIQRMRVGNDAIVGIHPLSLLPDQMPAYLINIKKGDPYEQARNIYYKTTLFGPFQIPIYQKTPLQ